ncbi:MAG: tRNA (adenosine(37)-N6)-threonylcarbamoyltransferase complex ATPase subunit type 1 TsaE [Bacteroidales bacterium]|nr:tRNA (adenosine(37)-N6)-threonylcarbamoyltransferase complex ATPase subunit type 1 TsaE [Bacteroidales bacterium]
MERKVEIRNLADLERAAAEFLERIGERRLVAFYAPLGSGKTTFTAALCRQLGVEETVNSPTFTILNEYCTSSGEMLYHFDFYRIKDLREAVDIGLDDYLYSGCLCLMEWPENVEPLLPEETLRVRIIVNDDLSRTLVWEE